MKNFWISRKISFSILIALSFCAIWGFSIRQDRNRAGLPMIASRHPSDHAVGYKLDDANRLSRIFSAKRGREIACPLADAVLLFRAQANPTDKFVAYYVNWNRQVFAVSNTKLTKDGRCPETLEHAPLASQAEYFTLLQVPRNPFVGVLRTLEGELFVWDGDGVVRAKHSGINRYTLNSCAGQEDRKFSEYIIFASTMDGKVLKVRGDGEMTYANIPPNFGLENFRHDSTIGVCERQ